MADAISDFLNQYGGNLLQAGMQIYAQQDSAARANVLANTLQNLNAEAAKVLIEGGYQGSLAAAEGLKPEATRILNEYENFSGSNVGAYRTANQDIAEKYGTDMGTTYAESVPHMIEGYQGMEERLQPYIGAGDQALNYLTQQMGIDPSQLTPSQKRLMEKYHRDVAASTAASGLRGSGRAGVAAVNEGLADLYANFHDQNLARSGAAATALNTQGYGATGAAATGARDLGQQMTQLTYGTGQDIAKKAGDLGAKTADQAFATGQQTAKERMETEGSLAQGLAKARQDTAQGIAQVKAQALNNTANTAAQKATLDTINRGTTFNTISNIFAGAKTAPLL